MLNEREYPFLSTGDFSENVTAVSYDTSLLFDAFERLKTFPLTWNYLHSKLDLVTNGFYFMAATHCVSDRCKCFFCNTVYIPSENLNFNLSLVVRHSPPCTFAQSVNTVSGNRVLGDITNMRLERNRLISFLKTNWTAPIDPYDLAREGFHWTGIADVGRCVFCRLEVRGWERGDRARSEHERWNRQCAYLLGRAVGNVPTNRNVGGDQTSQTPPVDTTVTPELQILSPEQLSIVKEKTPKHPQQASLASRMNSYHIWPMGLAQKPQHLSEAGFYYSGQGDRVICFHCGGGIKDWGPKDNPWVEHAVWFTKCPFLLTHKGPNFVAKVMQLKENQAIKKNLQQVNKRCSASSTSINAARQGAPTDVNIGEANENVVQMLTAEPIDLRATCKVCYEKELGIVFLPCGHMATCPDCFILLSCCPICRAKTNAVVRAFLP